MLRLLFIAPSAYLLGGVQDWLHALCQDLRTMGHHVVVGVPDGKYHCAERFNKNFKGLDAISFRNRTGTREGRIKAIARFLLENPADIIIGVNIGDLYEAYIVTRKRLKGAKIVFTLHAIEANYFKDITEYSNILDAVITTNRLAEKIVRNLKAIPGDRIFYAPYGIDCELGCRVKRKEGYLRIAWVGRIEDGQKRVSDLLGIVRELDKMNTSYQLSIAGTGPDRDDILGKLSEWIHSGRVIYKGRLDRDELDQFYKENDVLLITSEWETGPIVAWEALARDLAIVSSRYIGCESESALKNNKTALLFQTGDVVEAAKQLTKLKEDNLRDQLVRSGREMLLSRYTRPISTRAWEETFWNIVHSEEKEKLITRDRMEKDPTGRLEAIVGKALAERLRHVLPQRYPSDPGSEWPHSLQGIRDQSEILGYAKEIDRHSEEHKNTFSGLDPV